MEHRRPDVIERALDVGPDIAANIGPALAEGEVLGKISAGRRIDHAFEQREAVLARDQRVVRMLAEELQASIVRVPAHRLQRVAPDTVVLSMSSKAAGELRTVFGQRLVIEPNDNLTPPM